jgi:hypothetical protein
LGMRLVKLSQILRGFALPGQDGDRLLFIHEKPDNTFNFKLDC